MSPWLILPIVYFAVGVVFGLLWVADKTMDGGYWEPRLTKVLGFLLLFVLWPAQVFYSLFVWMAERGQRR